MGWVMTLLMVVQVVCALAIIVLVLLQHGKGADMGAAFGSGASGSLFGASGSANFLSRATAVAAAVFFIATIGMAYSSNSLRGTHGNGIMSTSGGAPAAPDAGGAPAAPAPASQGVPQEGVPASPAPATRPAAPAESDKTAGIPK